MIALKSSCPEANLRSTCSMHLIRSHTDPSTKGAIDVLWNLVDNYSPHKGISTTFGYQKKAVQLQGEGSRFMESLTFDGDLFSPSLETSPCSKIERPTNLGMVDAASPRKTEGCNKIGRCDQIAISCGSGQASLDAYGGETSYNYAQVLFQRRHLTELTQCCENPPNKFLLGGNEYERFDILKLFLGLRTVVVIDCEAWPMETLVTESVLNRLFSFFLGGLCRNIEKTDTAAVSKVGMGKDILYPIFYPLVVLSPKFFSCSQIASTIGMTQELCIVFIGLDSIPKALYITEATATNLRCVTNCLLRLYSICLT
eukprot:Gb_01965 [translate_table: standard]